MRLSNRKVTIDAMVHIPKRLADMDYIRSEFRVCIHEDGYSKTPSWHLLYEESATHISLPRHEGMKYIQREGITDYVDNMSSGYEVADKIAAIQLKDYQIPFVDELCRLSGTHNDIMAVAKTGGGKCLGVDVPILMYDGTTKAVQHIAVGDRLMGPDSLPRTVLSITEGEDYLYKIIPVKGDSFICNGPHILSLKVTGTDTIVNISVEDYLLTTPKYKHLHKLWRSGVDFLGQYIPFDPYIVGAYLGDGSRYHSQITIGNSNWEVYKYFTDWAIASGYDLREEEGRGCTEVTISRGRNNRFREYLLHSLINAYGEKEIPIEYLSNSREVRLQVLAGITDTDGSYYGGGYDFVFKDKPLAYGVAYLARSLGLAAYIKTCSKGIKSTGFIGKYYRVQVSGDASIIPCKVPRKKAAVRRQKKNVLLTGFSVEPQGIGKYYGFTLDGDRLFMLGDYTVTHNTIMGLELARRMATTVLVIVDQTNIKEQWIDRIAQHWGIPSNRVGIIQGSIKDYKDKTIVIGMLQTLYNSSFESELYSYFGMVIIDEAHVVAAKKFANVCNKFNAYLRIGLTATPRADQYRKIVEYHIGKPTIELESKHEESRVYYIEYGKPTSYTSNVSDKNGQLISELASDTERNWLLVNTIIEMYNEYREILVISDRIVQLENLYSMLLLSGVPDQDMIVITGKKYRIKYSKDDRPRKKPDGLHKGAEYTPIKVQWVEKRVSSKGNDALAKENMAIRLATYQLFGKAIDIPSMDTLIEATPRSKIEQVHGRILRKLDGKKVPVCITIRDINSYKCEYQFNRRLSGYKKDNATVSKYGGEEAEDYRLLALEVEDRVRWLQTIKIVQDVDGTPTLQT